MTTDPFLGIASFTVAPTKSGAEIKDAGGGALGSSDPSGSIADRSGTVFLRAPVRSEVERNSATIEMDIADAEGNSIASAKVVRYGIGPRSKKATVAVTDAQGAEVARLKATDKKGEELAITSGDAQYATMTVEEVKSGFLKKSRIYSVLLGSMPEPARLPVLALAIRYEAVLDEVASAAMKIQMKR